MPINELNAITTFSKAVDLGSIRQAALAQGVSAQAASQAIAQLERHLGVRLLHRTTRGLALTEEGQRFLENARPALASLEMALASARETRDDIAGPLRIVGPKSSFAAIVAPLLDEFCSSHPDIQPEVHLDDGKGDWVLDRVDVGFRVAASPDEGVIGRLLFPVQLIVCASPAYLVAHGTPRSLADLSSHRCGVFRHPTTGAVAPWYLNIDGEIERRLMLPSFATNDIDLELQMVLNGQTIGQVASLSAAHHIRAGSLVPVLVQNVSTPFGLHLYYGNRTAQPTRVRRFIELAVVRLSGSQAFTLTTDELERAASCARRTPAQRKKLPPAPAPISKITESHPGKRPKLKT